MIVLTVQEYQSQAASFLQLNCLSCTDFEEIQILKNRMPLKYFRKKINQTWKQARQYVFPFSSRPAREEMVGFFSYDFAVLNLYLRVSL